MRYMTPYRFPEQSFTDICTTRWMEFIPVSVNEAACFVLNG